MAIRDMKIVLILSLLFMLGACRPSEEKYYYLDGVLKVEKIKRSDTMLLREYFPDGDLKREAIIALRQVRLREFFPNDTLKIEAHYKEGKLEGKIYEYYENGKEKRVVNYSEGKLQGVALYYPTGIHQKFIYYVNGKYNGFVEFNEEGIPMPILYVDPLFDTIKVGKRYSVKIIWPFTKEKGTIAVSVGNADSLMKAGPITGSLPTEPEQGYAPYSFTPKQEGTYVLEGVVQRTKPNGDIRKYPFKEKYTVVK